MGGLMTMTDLVVIGGGPGGYVAAIEGPPTRSERGLDRERFRRRDLPEPRLHPHQSILPQCYGLEGYCQLQRV